jgi:hypothetical protein
VAKLTSMSLYLSKLSLSERMRVGINDRMSDLCVVPVSLTDKADSGWRKQIVSYCGWFIREAINIKSFGAVPRGTTAV